MSQTIHVTVNGAAREAEVDRILDKVSEKGLPSLSAREKKILREATDRARDH